MSDTALRVENLSKKYYLRHQQGARYTALRDVLAGSVRSFGRKLRPSVNDDNPRREEFWALKDVSFEVKRGEAIGIIGRNGAGKSTLLKILSRITPPTAGKITGDGRVASLLEVGTGFHPELTGRENIYLNGAILGMSRTDIKRKFDEIVDFAEVEKFLDTPVKRYSSGMYVRLAFAVAAHLEPEILIVDEVLAVGDAAFQKKCLGKMSDVSSKEGRTVLFVSHNMPSVQQLCSSGIVLDKGQISFNGQMQEAISIYTQKTLNTITAVDLLNRSDRTGRQSLRFSDVTLHDIEGHQLAQVVTGKELILRFHYISETVSDHASVNIAFNVYNSSGILLTNLNTRDINKMEMPVGKNGYFECCWPRFNLRTGLYTCNLFCEVNNVIEDWIQAAFHLNVEDGDFYNSGFLIDRAQGDMLISYNWKTVVCDTER